MLAISLRVGDVVEIGADVLVKLIFIRTKGGEIRLGIDAPRDRKIWRRGQEPPEVSSPQSATSPACAPVCLRPGMIGKKAEEPPAA